jgi:hypothetical protein
MIFCAVAYGAVAALFLTPPRPFHRITTAPRELAVWTSEK